jgi:hypothetical protein
MVIGVIALAKNPCVFFVTQQAAMQAMRCVKMFFSVYGNPVAHCIFTKSTNVSAEFDLVSFSKALLQKFADQVALLLVSNKQK